MEPKLPTSIVLEEPQIPQRKDFDYIELPLFHNRSHNYSPDHVKIDEFAELAKETFRRYEESNQRIDAFRLSLTSGLYVRFGFATEWTLNALKLGATDLTFRSRQHPNIAILLKQAVFGNENVVRLCLESSTIDQLQVTECPGLKSLTLNGLSINSNALFDLISCCPSVEDLSLSKICWKGNIEDFQSTASVPTTLILHELRSLVLIRVHSLFRIKTLFLDDLSSKFTNLKHLTLGITQDCSGPKHEVINLSSASLETLNINMEQLGNRAPRFEFDVPSIRKFTFEVDGKCSIPDVSFRSISAGYQWEESRVSITNEDNAVGFYTDPVSPNWFCRLSKFLTNLRRSKIHLCLHLHSKKIFDYQVEEINGLDVCEVEDLNLDINDLPNLACHAFLDSLFRICRPKTITQYARPPDNNNNDGANSSRNNDLVICRLLEGAMQGKNVLLPTQFMYAFRDLEEVDAQQLIDEVWMPQPLGSILADVADSTSDQKSKRRFRFQLKWKPLGDVVS